MNRMMITLAALALSGSLTGSAKAQDAVPVVDQSQVPEPEAYPQGYPPQQQQQQPQAQPPPTYAQPTYAQPTYTQPVQPAQQPTRPMRPRRVPYEEGMQIPPGAEVTRRVRVGLVISGGLMFAIPFLATVFTYAVSVYVGGDISGTLAIPAVGPFLNIPDAERSTGRFFLALDGALQTTGLVLLAVGLAGRKYVTYYGDNSEPGWALTPRIGRTQTGLDLNVRF